MGIKTVWVAGKLRYIPEMGDKADRWYRGWQS